MVYVTSSVNKWPGAMWRFLAINDPEAEYVIFRDADSVVSHREAEAVAEWIESGHSFHTMRDSGSHTALILAGMWGLKLAQCQIWKQEFNVLWIRVMTLVILLISDFLAEDLWGYIRQDVFSHDRVFNFCNAKPFLRVLP